ncbi:hypothetical protein PGB90_005480 [Kerria lacca]
MEPHQILKPKRTRGTPFQKFYLKTISVVGVLSIIVGYTYHYFHINIIDKKYRAGLFKETTKNREKKFWMSHNLIFKGSNLPDKYFEEYQLSQEYYDPSEMIDVPPCASDF